MKRMALTLLLLAACDSPADPGSPWADGLWQMSSVLGQPLPMMYVDTVGIFGAGPVIDSITVQSGALTVQSGSHATWTDSSTVVRTTYEYQNPPSRAVVAFVLKENFNSVRINADTLELQGIGAISDIRWLRFVRQPNGQLDRLYGESDGDWYSIQEHWSRNSR